MNNITQYRNQLGQIVQEWEVDNTSDLDMADYADLFWALMKHQGLIAVSTNATKYGDRIYEVRAAEKLSDEEQSIVNNMDAKKEEDAAKTPEDPKTPANVCDETDAPAGYMAVPADPAHVTCKGCAFDGKSHAGQWAPLLKCMSSQRKDRTAVIFVKLPKDI